MHADVHDQALHCIACAHGSERCSRTLLSKVSASQAGLAAPGRSTTDTLPFAGVAGGLMAGMGMGPDVRRSSWSEAAALGGTSGEGGLVDAGDLCAGGRRAGRISTCMWGLQQGARGTAGQIASVYGCHATLKGNAHHSVHHRP